MLFRKEALEHARDRLYGEINLAAPLSWQIVGYVLLSGLMVATGFLAAGSYSKTEQVYGEIAPKAGMITIIAPRSGVISRVFAADNNTIQAGDPLLSVTIQDANNSDFAHQDSVLQSLKAEDAQLVAKEAALSSREVNEVSQIEAKITGLTDEISVLNYQIELQISIASSLQRDLESIASLAKAGVISLHVFNQRRVETLVARKDLALLLQTRVSRNSELAQGQQAIGMARAVVATEQADVRSQRAVLQKNVADATAESQYTVEAPISGTITAFTGKLGQHVDGGKPVAVIIPQGAVLQAELHVPSSAIGFLSSGQLVHLALDAFPYQTYGTVAARISRVASAPVPAAGSTGEPVYPVVADLSQQSVEAFGSSVPLLSGMRLSARIIMQNRSIFEVLFEPLFALRRR